jgi:hypothetical protein
VDVDLDRVASDLVLPAVEPLFELRARQHDAGALGQRFQQRVLAPRQGHRPPVDLHLARRRLERHGPVLEHRRRAPARAPRQRAYARAQLVEVERLHQIVVGAGVEALHPVGHGIARGDDEHGHVVAQRAQAPQHLQAVAARQPQVEQHGAVRLRAQGGFGGDAVAHPVDRVPFLGKPVAHALADHPVVFHQQ